MTAQLLVLTTQRRFHTAAYAKSVKCSHQACRDQRSSHFGPYRISEQTICYLILARTWPRSPPTSTSMRGGGSRAALVTRNTPRWIEIWRWCTAGVNSVIVLKCTISCHIVQNLAPSCNDNAYENVPYSLTTAVYKYNISSFLFLLVLGYPLT